MAKIPETPADITAAWLAEVLSLDSAAIEQVKLRSVEAESGLVSVVVFVEFVLAPGVQGPTRLVAKLAPTHEGARKVVTDFELFAREEGFYRDIAPRPRSAPFTPITAITMKRGSAFCCSTTVRT